MKKLLLFAATLLFAVGASAETIFSFTVTSATTATGTYADGAAVLSGSAMATGGSNEVAVGDQTFYKFNSSSKWTFNLGDSMQEGDSIILTVASNASSTKKNKGLIINGDTLLAASIPAAGTATIVYVVAANDGIAGTNTLVMTRADSDIKFGTIVIVSDRTPSVKYTVSYYDGETLLGSEKVKEGETPANAALYQTKDHYTFDGWFNEASLTTPADFTAAITADKAFYGKWTAETFTASTSVNIEQYVLTNGKNDAGILALYDAAHITYADLNTLDSLNDAKSSRNEPYLGQKIKTTGGYMEMGLNAGDVLRVKFGHVESDVKITIAGTDSTLAVADAANPFEYTAAANCYVRIASTTSKTLVFKQIMINEPIAEVTLPASPEPTALENTDNENAAEKIMINGQLFIRKNGVLYNSLGQQL